MIFAISGATGSGKSFFMFRLGLSRWRSGDDVYTNVMVLYHTYKAFSFFEYALFYFKLIFSKVFHFEIKPLRRGDIYFFEVIDEILDATDGIILFDDGGVIFNGKNWQAIPIEFTYKLQLHRHHCLDLYVTVPSVRSIMPDYRCLIHKWYFVTRVIGIGSQKRSFFSLHKVEHKDIDYVEQVDRDVNAPTIKTRYFFIHLLSRRLYDTLAHIGFRRYKVIWLQDTIQSQVWIIPKELSLSAAQKSFFSLKQALKPNRFKISGKR